MAGPSDAWVPDILGKPFEQLTMPLGVQGAQGELVATLVRSIPNPLLSLFAPLRDVDVLYIHGWSDYFFQRDVAQFWTSRGARFYALDLRRYGRSLREGMTPGYIDALEDYDVDIAHALAAMGQGTPQSPSARRLVLMGHSTGGLTLTLWASRHPGRVAALVLNSPWLELQIGALGRQALAPLVEMRAKIDPRGAQPEVDFGFYTRAQEEIGSLPTGPERGIWRPDRGFPTAPGWLAAVMGGHRRIAGGIDVACPAFVLLSAHSTTPISWKESMTSTDSVLWVDDIARAATLIGRGVTISRIEGAIHDVFLSRAQPRADAFAALRQWSDGYIAHH